MTDLGYRIIAVSPDPLDKARETAAGKDLEYTLLSDPELLAARAYGVAYRTNDKQKSTTKKYAGEEMDFLLVPSVFIIGTDGVIRFTYVNPNHRVTIHGAVLLAAAKASLDQP